MREFSLTFEDVNAVKEHLSATTDITVRTILRDLYYFSSEVEILLAVLYAGLTEEMIDEQYSAATHIPVQEVSDVWELNSLKEEGSRE